MYIRSRRFCVNLDCTSAWRHWSAPRNDSGTSDIFVSPFDVFDDLKYGQFALPLVLILDDNPTTNSKSLSTAAPSKMSK
jgi:hypothetical protein